MVIRRELFFQKRTVWKTTWLLRLLVAGTLVAFLFLTGRFWLEAVGRSLIHSDALETVDLIVVEDFDDNFWLYRRAARLVEQGRAPRVIVVRSEVRAGARVAAALAEEAGLSGYELMIFPAEEPITLNAARLLSGRLSGQPVRSMIVVADGFRSRRTRLVVASVFQPQGVRVLVRPVLGPRQPDNWWRSWHGIQSILLEFLKLQYYRFWVLRATS